MYHWIQNKALGILWSAASYSAKEQDRGEVLRRLLRRYPRWIWGHRLLAEDSFTRNDVGAAYAASLCYRQLTRPNTKEFAYASFFLGRCFLQRGDWRSALAHLEAAQHISPDSYEILEELAAAHMLAENYSAVAELITAIPEDRRSAQAKAALAFAATRLNAELV